MDGMTHSKIVDSRDEVLHKLLGVFHVVIFSLAVSLSVRIVIVVASAPAHHRFLLHTMTTDENRE